MLGAEPEVFSRPDFASYQAGSVVSKQVIKKETGTETLFAFDEGQELFNAMVHVFKEEADIRIARRRACLV